MTSTWKSLSNRRNSAKSTGPKSDEGKEQSRANALKHGLSGAGVVVGKDNLETILDRLEEWRSGYASSIDGPDKEWAYEQLVINSVRIEQCQRQELSLREYDARRAELVWEIDKEADAAILGARLSKEPEVVARRLRKSKYGCAWMIERWNLLGGVLKSGRDWNEEELQHALDLTGLPRLGRENAAPADPSGLVASEVSWLESLIAEGHEELDDIERPLAENGDPIETSKAISNLRRYEAACVKRMESARRLLRKSTLEVLEAIPSPAPSFDPYAPEIEEQMAIRKAFSEYNKAYDEASEEARASLAPNLPATVLASIGTPPPTPVRLRDAIPTSKPMNRKQRRAMKK